MKILAFDLETTGVKHWKNGIHQIARTPKDAEFGNYFGSWFWSDTIDVMVLASNHLKDKRHEMENFKQGTVAKFLGIEIDENRLHDALYDITVCLNIYGKVGHITT